MTTGTDQSPFERYRVRAASLTIWSKAGWMKSANWISATGIRPFSAAPMATPTMQDSAKGVSRTRSSPNCPCRPSVARKTPPFLPTSSPSTQTRSSRSISSWSASLRPSISVLIATSSSLLEHVLEQVLGKGWCRRFGDLDRLVHLGRAVLLDLLVRRLGEHRLLHEVGAEALDGVAPEKRLQLLLRAVAPLVVVGRVGCEAGDLGVDQRRAVACPSPGHGVSHALVHGQA